MKILTDTVENFFHSPKSMIDYAESLKYYRYEEHPDSNVGRYAGLRTDALHKLNPEYFKVISEKIIFKTYGLEPIEVSYRMSCYFSKINARDKSKNKSDIERIHRDKGILRAGVIYLRGDRNSGTTLYKNEKNIFGGLKKQKQFKADYNKMISYDGNTLHGISNYCNDRLVVVFFIKHISTIYNIKI